MWRVLGLLFSKALAAPRTIWDVGESQGHVGTLETLPSAEEFWTEYMTTDNGAGRPVLLAGAAKLMPAWTKWQTDDDLRKLYAKEHMDQVETEKTETRTKYPYDDWNLGTFLDNYNTSNIYSTSMVPKGMMSDMYFLPMFSCGGYSKNLRATVLWMSSGGTASVIHKDGHHNQHCCFSGTKEWILWHPADKIDTKKMGWINGEEEQKIDPAFKDTYGTFAGRVNVKDMDETIKRYPRWEKIKFWRMTLKAGDCAYIPPGWYHYVEGAPQRSLTVHVWFDHGRSSPGFARKGCKELEERGHDLSQPIIRFSDCSFSEDGKPTKCKIKKKSQKTDL